MVSSRVKTAWVWLSFSTLSKECPHETWSAKLAEHECPSDSHCFHSAVPQLVIILEADNLPGALSSMNFVFITFSSLENLICLLLQSQQLYCHSTLPLFMEARQSHLPLFPGLFITYQNSDRHQYCLPLSPTPLHAVALAGVHVNCIG